MRPVLDDQGPPLQRRVGRVDDAAQERLEPAPVLGARLEELAAGEARRVDTHPAPATEDEALERVLLVLGHVERRQVELDHHRVAGELLVAKDGGVVGEVDGEAALGPQGGWGVSWSAHGPTCSSTAKSPGFQACAMM